MSLHVYADIEQRSDEWHEIRRGLVTASSVAKLVTSRAMNAIEYDCPSCGAGALSPCLSRGRKVAVPIKEPHGERKAVAAAKADTSPRILDTATGDDARNLTFALVAERLTGFSEPSFTNDDMWRGIEEEPRARDKYAETREVEVREVGFMTRDDWGYEIGLSPDGLVGDDGLIEIKAPRAKSHLRTILADEVPAQHAAQLQTALLVSGRKWIDFVSWFGGMPMFVKRVYPDPAWHAAIVAAVAQFEKDAAEMCAAYTQATEGMPATERAPQLEEIVI